MTLAFTGQSPETWAFSTDSDAYEVFELLALYDGGGDGNTAFAIKYANQLGRCVSIIRLDGIAM